MNEFIKPNDNETYVIIKVVIDNYSIESYYCGVRKGLRKEYSYNVDTNRWEWKTNEKTTYIGYPVKNVDGNPKLIAYYYE